MDSSNSKSSSSFRDRKRTPMACTNCRERKLKCRPLQSTESAPCERCIKEKVFCEYRPVDPSSTSNNHASNYHDQGDPLTLIPVHSAPPPSQEEFALPVDQSLASYGGYIPNPAYNPNVQPPFQTNILYPTPPYQPHPSSYPVHTQYSYNTEYPADPSQFFGHPPEQFMPYPSAHGHGTRPYDHRGYPFNGYENMDGCNSPKE